MSDTAAPFAGFPGETFTFLRELTVNNNRDWFQQHRDDYEDYYLAPAKALVAALGPRMQQISPTISFEPRVNKSIFRINRDVRFSKDKTPYSPHLDLWFWEGEQRGWDTPGFFYRMTATELTLGAGMHRLDKPLLAAFRQVVVDDARGTGLEHLLQRIETSGPYQLGGATRKKVPRGFDAGHPRAALLLHEGLVATVQHPLPDEVYSAALVDHCVRHFTALSPLHQWLLAMRAEVPAEPMPRRPR